MGWWAKATSTTPTPHACFVHSVWPCGGFHLAHGDGENPGTATPPALGSKILTAREQPMVAHVKQQPRKSVLI